MSNIKNVLNILKNLKAGEVYYFLDLNSPDIKKRIIKEMKISSIGFNSTTKQKAINLEVNNKFSTFLLSTIFDSDCKGMSVIHLLTNKKYYGKLYNSYELASKALLAKNLVYIHNKNQKIKGAINNNRKQLKKLFEKQKKLMEQEQFLYSKDYYNNFLLKTN